ncbi:hypothetical protein PSU4_48910 [Pseudonocardia sulfidoxydans NBRC 16205]|uniref:DUF2537 domain-containing protein n=1 Tax=Pseudonocardia sulfidoxydans NBRC 16205 TaxID=1223511 RepID=A0A511DNH8_9PSEU|nr:DUF2537 domain-containing protein [Pseudonocardia sulfidoxydans]GEL25937.1 hypothetical protein PSU4_48910 [Pseudonocardia sulfidoxydans NBRC 16205]
MQLAEGGEVEIGGRRPDDPELPAELVVALREWGEVASRPDIARGPDEQELVRRRGRQLAGRCAEALGRPVDFHDPVTGRVEIVSGRLATQRAVVPAPRPEPVPWATGLPIAAFFGVLATVVVVVLSTAVDAAFGLLWIPANVLIGAGLAPSLWLLRRVPLWRWVALGVAVGVVVAWVWMLANLLAP